MKVALKVVAAGIALYVLISGAFFLVMSQQPEAIAKTMMHVPWAAFRVFPLRRIWMKTRSGSIQPGQLALDFSLESPDHRSHFQLSSLRGQKPVVLVFGSYT